MALRSDRDLDGFVRSSTPGLIDELTEWFTVRFDKIRELDFQTCPGEQRCETGPGNRIYRFLKEYPDRQIEQICGDCRLRDTKPGKEPEHLAMAIWIANQLDEDSLVCGGFEYPAILDYLDPFEYACLIAIKAARQASENKAMKKPEQEGSRNVDIGHLKRLAHS